CAKDSAGTGFDSW
nr:immunoglobulin heavy chain junction region [Macaca mulatta]MOW75727.1 immunoglobulin heavy chain junction region [Macaca mulatta]MOW76012.1 immunoglobulin heavy chain junction region [Macaca mulatta]MOW76171.1 immunoglobulin heavy chain junction region [Macaca mulatta]MOW78370.1 immunoglobulin heavy chain junction region [Macaca mulatta]